MKELIISIKGDPVKYIKASSESISLFNADDYCPEGIECELVERKTFQLPNTEFDERTYDFIQRYLNEHGFTDAANELNDVKKFFEF
tara:strand:+ start:382 stop:642 length:261 start_codon:yes stop_codon:yes gene_type:complete